MLVLTVTPDTYRGHGETLHPPPAVQFAI